MTELKALQVKAELSKLPDPPRAYEQKINAEDDMDMSGNSN